MWPSQLLECTIVPSEDGSNFDDPMACRIDSTIAEAQGKMAFSSYSGDTFPWLLQMEEVL